MQLSFRLDKRPGESHLALDGKKSCVCPGVSVVVWFVCFPVGVLWCCGCVLAFGGCCLFLPLLFCAFFVCVVWGCFGLARFLLAASPPCPARPLGWSLGAFWSSQFSGPSLRVSGCILRRPGCHACGMECSDG